MAVKTPLDGETRWELWVSRSSDDVSWLPLTWGQSGNESDRVWRSCLRKSFGVFTTTRHWPKEVWPMANCLLPKKPRACDCCSIKQHLAAQGHASRSWNLKSVLCQEENLPQCPLRWSQQGQRVKDSLPERRLGSRSRALPMSGCCSSWTKASCLSSSSPVLTRGLLHYAFPLTVCPGGRHDGISGDLVWETLSLTVTPELVSLLVLVLVHWMQPFFLVVTFDWAIAIILMKTLDDYSSHRNVRPGARNHWAGKAAPDSWKRLLWEVFTWAWGFISCWWKCKGTKFHCCCGL